MRLHLAVPGPAFFRDMIFEIGAPSTPYMEHYQVFCCSYFQVCYLKFLLSKFSGIFPFIRDPENVLSVKEFTFLHEMARCFKVLQTRELLRNSNISFFSFSKFPGKSFDLNVCKKIGSILKNRVEERTANYDGRPSLTDLRRVVTEVLREMEFDAQLFCDSLK